VYTIVLATPVPSKHIKAFTKYKAALSPVVPVVLVVVVVFIVLLF